METKENKLIIKFTNIILAIIFFIMYIIFYNDYMTNFITNPEVVKTVLSWLGIILYIYIVFSWYKLNGKIFDLYTIMITFFMLFNYGQCFLWAFGIHTDTEIGKDNSLGVGIATDKEIIVSQLITLMCVYLFHVGSCLCIRKDRKPDNEEEKFNKISIYKVSKILSFIVIPVTFVKLLMDISISSKYGYGALYYGDNMNQSFIIEMLYRLFYPCLFGLLIGSNSKKNVRHFVYIVLMIFIILSLLTGDRGGWAYSILIFAFLHNNYVKKFDASFLIKCFIIVIIFLNVVTAIVSVRKTGISIDNVKNAMVGENNPIISTISEMGGSMIIQTTLVKVGYDIYPYGNTYIFSILGIISDKFINFLGIPYINVSNWFSQKYLGLNNWGAGFSIVRRSFDKFWTIYSTNCYVDYRGYFYKIDILE